MKIKQNTSNINKESKEALRQFRQNQILINIKYHKILLFIITIINIGLIFFVFFYKAKLREISSLTNNHSTNINSREKEFSSKKTMIDKKIINIASLNINARFRFSLIFDKSDDFNNVRNLAYKYNNKTESPHKQTFFLYQSNIDSDEFEYFIKRIMYFDYIFIFIQTEKGNRFGIFFTKLIIPDDNYEFELNSELIYLYSFETNKIYNFIGDKKKSLSFKKDKLITLGDDELIIYNRFWDEGGYINYPLKSFELRGENSNIFTGENGKFNIKYIEVYSFFIYYI